MERASSASSADKRSSLVYPTPLPPDTPPTPTKKGNWVQMEKQKLLIDEESILERQKKFRKFEVPRCHIAVNNLTVVPKESGETKKLLDDVSFYAKPGEMTLILGEPGCGKTTLLSVLANHSPTTIQTGTVLFNNNVIQPKIHQRVVGFVTQEDLHIPTLTVRQTMDFSLACQYAAHLTDEWKKEAVDLILEILDLTHVQHTLVGSDLIRGVSGGQRKRVTIGVALTKGALALLMDEPTTGLDANTSFSIINSLRKVCSVLRIPAIIALLQPSPEICNLFDNLLILNKGQVGYFGPYQQAVPYFDKLGIRGTTFQSDPEFLQEAVANCQRYQETSSDIAHQITPTDLIRIYHDSDQFKSVQDEIKNMTSNEDINLTAEMQEKIKRVSRYTIPFKEQVKLNMWREGLTNKQDKGTVLSRVIRKVVMALVAGSLFFDLPEEQSGLKTRQAVLFFALLFLAMGSLGSIESFYAARKVYYHQRESFYYSPAAYFICKTLMELLHMSYENLIFSCIIYWMVGLNADAGRFFFFYLLVSVTELFSVNVCRFMSSAIATQTVSMGLTPTIFAFFILFAGFLITPPTIPNWWIWLYYISPFHYSLESLLINELVGTHYHCKGSELVPPKGYPLLDVPYPDGYSGVSICPIQTGEQQLELLDMHTTVGWKWYYLVIICGYAVVSMGLALWGLQSFYFPSKSYKKPAKVKKPKVRKLADKAETPRTAQGVYMTWDKLSYSVDVKKDGQTSQLALLKNISGFVRPGMLMALMGPSGAGKSTLLDVLARRKTGGHIQGEVRINGKPQDKFFARFTGYVEQNDMLMPLATVREAIEFSARTRLPEQMSMATKMRKVDEVLKLLELEGIQMMLGQNLSLEQRKRLTIGVELAADPQLLFLDEPTSGLDSVAAVIVMNVVKKVAETGRSVICTIHQPSASVFSYFDYLFLLKKGGETVYFGPTGENCADMMKYFASIGWVCPQKKNPADFILDVASATSLPADIEGGRSGNEPWDPSKEYATSQQRQDMEAQISYLPAGVTVPTFDNIYAASLSTQLRTGVGRAVRTAWRSREDIRSRIMKNTLMSVLIGTSFLQLDLDQQGLGNRFVVIFFAAMLNCLNGGSVIPVVVNERSVFYREDAAKAIRPFVYLLGLTVAEMVVTFITTIFMAFPLYWIVGLRPDASSFLFFWWVCYVFACQQMTWAHFLAIVSPNGEVAQGLASMFMSIFSLFAGFMITKPQIPVYWIWMYYLSLMHYPVETLLVNELDGVAYSCPGGDGAVPIPINATTTKLFCPFTSGNVLLDSMSLETSSKIPDMLIIIGIWGGLIALCLLGLKYIRQIKR